MIRLRLISCAISLALLVVLFGGLMSQPIALAVSQEAVSSSLVMPAQEEPQEEGIKLNSQYPTLSSYAGLFFTFDVQLQYTGGEEPRVFDLRVDVPSGFQYSITPAYGEGSEIAAIQLDPNKTYGDSIKVGLRPSYAYLVPEPGEYTITVEVIEASEGKIRGSIELKAIVLGSYDLQMDTQTGKLNTEATVGEDTTLIVIVRNTGTAELENINLSSTARNRPAGWSVNFVPEKIESLPVGGERVVEVTVGPSEKTIAGDYMFAMEAETDSRNAWDNLEIRVTVKTPTIWGWLGVGIVVAVIVGLILMFLRLGRR